MRQFYLAFPILHAARAESSKEKNTSIGQAVPDQSMDISIRDTLRNELSWSHYRLLMKVDNPDERNYYIQECIGQNWSTRTLERQINSLYFERLLSSKNKKVLIAKVTKEAKQDSPIVLDFVKDPYVFKFFPTAHFFNTILLPVHIGTLSFALPHKANRSATAKEPILPTF